MVPATCPCAPTRGAISLRPCTCAQGPPALVKGDKGQLLLCLRTRPPKSTQHLVLVHEAPKNASHQRREGRWCRRCPLEAHGSAPGWNFPCGLQLGTNHGTFSDDLTFWKHGGLLFFRSIPRGLQHGTKGCMETECRFSSATRTAHRNGKNSSGSINVGKELFDKILSFFWCDNTLKVDNARYPVQNKITL